MVFGAVLIGILRGGVSLGLIGISVSTVTAYMISWLLF